MLPSLNANDQMSMTLICSTLGAMHEEVNVEELMGALDGIIDDFDVDPKFEETHKFGNIFIKGEGISGVMGVKVNKQVNTYGDDHSWLSVHEVRIGLSKEVYEKLLAFAKRVGRGIWGQETEFKWHDKGLPFGTAGKVTLDGSKVSATFEKQLFGDRKLIFQRAK
jgi:hypothetical protein